MAGDWIKMRTDLYRDPKVCAIADRLMDQEGELAGYVSQNCQRSMTVTRNVMRNVTVGALVSVWGVMRLRGKRINDDLVFRSGTLWVIDDLSELPGFGEAMAYVGWVVADQDGITFPNFFSEYNSDPNEDAKAKNAERQRRYREKTKQKSDVTEDVTEASQSNAREEKRREEVNPKTKTPKPPTPDKPARFDPLAIELPDCVTPEAWAKWIAYRRARKLTTAEPTVRGQAAKLAEWHKAGHGPTEIIEASITNGWQGLFEPKDSRGNERYDDKLQRTADALTGRNRRPADGEAGRTLDGEARAVD